MIPTTARRGGRRRRAAHRPPGARLPARRPGQGPEAVHERVRARSGAAPPRPARRRRVVRAAQGAPAATAWCCRSGRTRAPTRRPSAGSAARRRGADRLTVPDDCERTTWDPRSTSASTTTAPARSTTCSPGSAPRRRAGSSTWAAARATSRRCWPRAGRAPRSRRSTRRRRWSTRPGPTGIDAERRATSSTGRRSRTPTSSSPTRCCSGCRRTRSCCAGGPTAMPAGGWLAVQVPGNFGAPSHVADPRARGRAALAGRGHAARRRDRARARPATRTCSRRRRARSTSWETTYLQRLTGDDPVLRWISGTALRPVRDALDDAAYAAFVGELAPRLRAAYPPSAGRDDVVPVPPRLRRRADPLRSPPRGPSHASRPKWMIGTH